MPTSAPGQCRGVVDPVAHHRHGQAAGLQLGHRALLVGRQHLGEHLVHAGLEAQVRGDSLGHRPRVTGDHHDLPHALPAELGDGLTGFGAHLVLQAERPEHGRRRGVEAQQVQHSGPAFGPLRRGVFDGIRPGDLLPVDVSAGGKHPWGCQRRPSSCGLRNRGTGRRCGLGWGLGGR